MTALTGGSLDRESQISEFTEFKKVSQTVLSDFSHQSTVVDHWAGAGDGEGLVQTAVHQSECGPVWF